MATELVKKGDINDYGAAHDNGNLVIPLAMLDRTRHPTSSSKPPSSSRPSSWKTKKIVLGIIGVMSAVVLVSSARLFFSGMDASSAVPLAARSGPESVLLQLYPYVTITNKTPYNVLPQGGWNFPDSVSYLVCKSDFMYNGLPAWQTWTASSRGLCLVNRIDAVLTFPDGRGGITCTPYTSTGTSYSQYSILMKWDNLGDDACCVRSSNQIQKCD